jgi:probable HAF family extracellular repeat protein
MTAAQRLGMGGYFFVRMDEFTAHPERYQDFQFQTAAGEVDRALSETIKYMSAEQAGRQPVETKEELSNLWQAASRAVAPLDPIFSEACYHKALGWLSPQEWDHADKLGVKTDLEFIKSERIKLIQLARVQLTPKQIEPANSDHLVILIHGFNTFAKWMDDVKEALRKRGFAANATGYGYFGFTRFLSFPACRKNAVRLVIRDLELAIALYQNEHNGQRPKKISVIAHSFGTWLLMRILEDNPQYKCYRIIFCGSILRNDFDLRNLYEKRQFEKIVNHIGTKDYWPVIGESAGWRYGSIGSQGLLSPVADNRCHTDLKHSDFLTPTFCTTSCIPFLEGNDPPPGDRWKELPFWVRAVTFIPLRWIIILLVLVSISLAAYFTTVFVAGRALQKSQGFQGLGHVPGFSVSSVAKISSDGKVVIGDVGQAARENTYPAGAMRWSATGMVYLGTPNNRAGVGVTESLGVSADGSVVVGYYGYGGNCAPNQPWRWTAAGMVPLSGSGSSVAYDVNANGTVIAGSLTPCVNNQAGNNQAAIYTDATGWIALGFLPGSDSSGAYGVNADGTVVVGQSPNSCPQNCQAFRWTQQTGMVGLGFLQGANSSHATRVSSDGTTTVGSSSYPNGNAQAFRWTAAAGMVGLGYLFGASSSGAAHVNADGSVVVGSSGGKAFRWTASDGMRSIEDLLTAAGVSFAGWQLQAANGVSGDGTVIAGTGIDPSGLKEAWIATLSKPK